MFLGCSRAINFALILFCLSQFFLEFPSSVIHKIMSHVIISFKWMSIEFKILHNLQRCFVSPHRRSRFHNDGLKRINKLHSFSFFHTYNLASNSMSTGILLDHEIGSYLYFHHCTVTSRSATSNSFSADMLS